MPDAPDDAADQAAFDASQLFFQHGVHNPPPAGFLPQGKEHIEPGGPQAGSQTRGNRVHRQAHSAIFHLCDTLRPQACDEIGHRRIKGCREQNKKQGGAQGAQHRGQEPGRGQVPQIPPKPGLPAQSLQSGAGQEPCRHGREHGHGQHSGVSHGITPAQQDCRGHLQDPGNPKGPGQISSQFLFHVTFPPRFPRRSRDGRRPCRSASGCAACAGRKTPP